MQGLSGFDLPRQEKFFSKAISQRHLTYLQEGAERFSPL
jgi:hypothetical protein